MPSTSSARRTPSADRRQQAAVPRWPRDWSAGLRIWIERRGRAVLGEGRADLLAGIRRTRSISAAAREIGMSYRHAWLLVQAVNEAAGETLVASAVGGKRGGGAELTEKGVAALALFHELSRELRRSAATTVSRIAAAGRSADSTAGGVAPSPRARSSTSLGQDRGEGGRSPGEGETRRGRRPRSLPAAINALTINAPATPADHPCLRLAAAVSLQEVVGEILTEYALVHAGASIRTLFGASNELADQIVRGTNIDLLLTGDPTHAALLRKAGAFNGAPKAIATNGLAAVAAQGRVGADAPPAAVRKASDLRRASFARIAVADKACPLGQVTEEFLTRQKLAPALASKTLVVDNSRAVLAAIRGGRADLGLVFSSDAVQAIDCRTLFRVPSSQASATYYALPLGHAGEEVESLVEFLTSPTAQRCYRRCGLGPAPL